MNISHELCLADNTSVSSSAWHGGSDTVLSACSSVPGLSPLGSFCLIALVGLL